MSPGTESLVIIGSCVEYFNYTETRGMTVNTIKREHIDIGMCVSVQTSSPKDSAARLLFFSLIALGFNEKICNILWAFPRRPRREKA